MQTMWLCILPSKLYEETLENAQCWKVKNSSYFYTFSHESSVAGKGREGRYWKIQPLLPQDFPQASPLGNFFGPQKISRASGMDFPSFGGALVHSHPPFPHPQQIVNFCHNYDLLNFVQNSESWSEAEIWSKFWKLVKLWKFGQTLEIWSQFWNLVKISKFGQNYEIWRNSEIWLKFWKLVKILKFS